LALGKVTTTQSQVVPAGGVSSTSPRAGYLVDQGSRVDLEVSVGQRFDWSQYIPGGVFAVITLIVLGLIGWGISGQGGILASLAKEGIARGLIAFLIAIVTVGIALILVLSTILSNGNDAANRFDRGKQVLTAMIGILGTIVGFYFGSAVAPAPQSSPAAAVTITTTSLPDGFVSKPYGPTKIVSGGKPPLKWSISPALPAGLSPDDTGNVAGTPTTVSPKTDYKITVTDSATPPVSSSANITLEIKQ
jgi:hypothetical protein